MVALIAEWMKWGYTKLDFPGGDVISESDSELAMLTKFNPPSNEKKN